MKPEEKFKEISDNFKRLSDNMCETICSFYIWETLYLSRSIPEMGKEQAEKNTQIINLHKGFFISTQNSHLDSFIIGISKFFDSSSKSLSIYFLVKDIERNKDIFTAETFKKVYPNRVDNPLVMESLKEYLPITKEDKLQIKKLKKEFSLLIGKLKTIRNTKSAHINIKSVHEDFVPKEVEKLIDAIQKMLNIISGRFDLVSTSWNGIKNEAIEDTKFLFENLYRGEQTRKEGIKKKYGH